MSLRSLLGAIPIGLRWVRRIAVLKTDPVRYARSLGVRIGDNVRLMGIHGGTFGTEPYLISIGNDVTVSSGVQFITHDGSLCTLRKEHPGVDLFGRICIGDNIFIGYGATILPGVRLGNNTIVAAGAVVTRSFASNVVIGGVPAKVLKSFDEFRASMLPRTVRIQHMAPPERRQYLQSTAELE